MTMPAPARAQRPPRPARFRLQALVVPLVLCAQTAAADVLFVPADFATIQQAIDAAQTGETVVVEPGLYTENITLRSGVDVRGEEAALTLLRAADLDDYTVLIDGVADVLFANFTLLDSDLGVQVLNSTEVIIANNMFDTLDDIAVDTDFVSEVDVMNNVFFDNILAIRRGSANTWIFNNIFAFNVETLFASTGGLHDEVSFNCFHANLDLEQGGIDTGLGTNFQVGDPLFVDVERGDFHLRLNSPCIDAGTGTDAIDDTVADIGAYGGPFADPWPFPVPRPHAEDTSAPAPPPFSLTLTWEPNLDYRVSNPADPGSYRVYYRLNEPGPPYDGTDAGGGTQPSPIDVVGITEIPNVITFELTDLSPQVAEPASPQLLSAEPRNEAVVLDWSGVAGATGYRVHYAAADADELHLDAGEETSLTVTGLDNGIEYTFRVTALAQPTYFLAVTVLDNTPTRHESVFSDEEAIEIGAPRESARSNALAATPDVVTPSPDLPDQDRCFIATAAFADRNAREVVVLRELRDRFLATHAPGRALVTGYYAISPSIARQLERRPRLKPVIRAALIPAVAVALFLVEWPPAAQVTTVGLLMLLAAAVLRRGTCLPAAVPPRRRRARGDAAARTPRPYGASRP